MNQNKTDKPQAAATENLRAQSRSAGRTAKKKRRGLFLLIDVLLLCGVIAAALFLVLALTPLSLFGGDTEPREILYSVEFSAVDKDLVSSFRVGDSVTDANTGSSLGVIAEVQTRDYETYVNAPTPEVVPEIGKHLVQKADNEEWKTVTLVIRVTADYEQGVGYKAQECRIAVGRTYQLLFPNYTDEGVCLSVTDGEVSP